MTEPQADALVRMDSFDEAIDFARDYLRTYFMGEVVPDDRVLMRFLVEQYPRIQGQPTLLEVGCGPNINHVLPAVPYVSRIHMCDLREDNLEEIRKWREGAAGAHDWTNFTTFVLRHEGATVAPGAVAARERYLRERIDRVFVWDLRRDPPVLQGETYAAVASFYAMEQASRSMAEWRAMFRRVCQLVAPGGWLFSCAVGESDHYTLYDARGTALRYAILPLKPSDFESALAENDFPVHESVVRLEMLTGEEIGGLNGVILVAARKAV